MGHSVSIPETVEYRVAFVSAESAKILLTENFGDHQMPRVSIPRWTRPAKELRKAIHASFGIDALILDFSATKGFSVPFAIAQVLSFGSHSSLVPVDLSSIPASVLPEEQRHRVETIVRGAVDNPFARIGWIREAIAWLENATGQPFASRGHFEQYSAGRGSSLVRFQMDNGSAYWLKATSGPNRHELAVTSALANLCGKFLPALVDTKTSWNAWITAEEAMRLEVLPRSPKELGSFLHKAVNSLAAVQIRTVGQTDILFAAGAFDQRPAVLCSGAAAFFAYLEEAMVEQKSTNAPHIAKKRLQELRHIFEDSCVRLEALGLPTTVVHGDMNLGNILLGTSHCQFIDWADAYVGSPLVTFQHLLLLNQVQDGSVRDSIDGDLTRQYRKLLLPICEEAEKFDEACLFMPLIAAFSALYVRGDWLTPPLRYDPRRQRYVRTLARHIDWAAREPQLISALRRERSSHKSGRHAVSASLRGGRQGGS